MSKSLKVPAVMNKRMTIGLIVIATIVLLIGGVGVYFLQTKQNQADKVVADKEALVGTNEQVAKRYDTTLASYNSTVDELKYVEPTMSKDSYVATLIQQLQRETAADHLTLTSVRPGPIDDDTAAAATPGDSSAKTAPPAYDETNVDLTVSGTYTQVMTFVYHMTKFPKIVSVQSVSFSPQGGGAPPDGIAKTPLLTANISLFAYIFPDTTAPQSGTSGVTNSASSSDNGNLLTNVTAKASANLGDVARAAIPLPNVADNSQGLVEMAGSKHSAKEGSVQ